MQTQYLCVSSHNWTEWAIGEILYCQQLASPTEYVLIKKKQLIETRSYIYPCRDPWEALQERCRCFGGARPISLTPYGPPTGSRDAAMSVWARKMLGELAQDNSISAIIKQTLLHYHQDFSTLSSILRYFIIKTWLQFWQDFVTLSWRLCYSFHYYHQVCVTHF